VRSASCRRSNSRASRGRRLPQRANPFRDRRGHRGRADGEIGSAGPAASVGTKAARWFATAPPIQGPSWLCPSRISRRNARRARDREHFEPELVFPTIGGALSTVAVALPTIARENLGYQEPTCCRYPVTNSSISARLFAAWRHRLRRRGGGAVDGFRGAGESPRAGVDGAQPLRIRDHPHMRSPQHCLGRPEAAAAELHAGHRDRAFSSRRSRTLTQALGVVTLLHGGLSLWANATRRRNRVAR